MNIGTNYVGCYWRGPWRMEWRRRFQYWDRIQCGPFYVLVGRPEESE